MFSPLTPRKCSNSAQLPSECGLDHNRTITTLKILWLLDLSAFASKYAVHFCARVHQISKGHSTLELLLCSQLARRQASCTAIVKSARLPALGNTRDNGKHDRRAHSLFTATRPRQP